MNKSYLKYQNSLIVEFNKKYKVGDKVKINHPKTGAVIEAFIEKQAFLGSVSKRALVCFCGINGVFPINIIVE